MSKTKQDYITELVLIAFKIELKMNKGEEKTKKIQRMASLARQGMRESEEFKKLENEFKSPTVIDFGNEMTDLKKVVKCLKRYKWVMPVNHSICHNCGGKVNPNTIFFCSNCEKESTM